MYTNLASPKPKPDPASHPKRISFGFSRLEYLAPPEPLNTPLGDVLAQRESGVDFRMPSMGQLSSFLWHSCHPKRRTRSETGRMWESRPTPSAGGTHSLDLLFLNLSLAPRSAWLYDPWLHAIGELENANEEKIHQLYSLAMEIRNEQEALVIWIVGQPHLLSAYYENYESLLWRDAGALLSTLSLVASGFGMKSRALGATGSPLVLEVLQAPVLGMGGLFLGI